MIAQTIQLALAPVFVLVAIGNIMNILSNRLARVVDRSRHLQVRHGQTEGTEHDMLVREIRLLDGRIHMIGRAILLLVCSALTIGVTVALLFLEEILQVDIQLVAAGFFFIAIALLMSALLLFLREIRLATSNLRIPESYLELERKI